MLDLQAVQPVTLGDGDAYLVTYEVDGTMTVDRVHSHRQRSTRAATFAAPPAAMQVVPVTDGGMAYVVVC